MRSVRVIPCLDVDAGRVVKGVNFVEPASTPATPPSWPPATTPRGPTRSSSSTSPPRPTPATPWSTWPGAPPRPCSSPSPSAAASAAPDDARLLLRAGADKVGVNTAAVVRPELVTELAGEFGAQCVVVAIDARRRPEAEGGGWQVFTHGGRNPTGRDAVAWAGRVREREARARSSSRRWIATAPATATTSS